MGQDARAAAFGAAARIGRNRVQAVAAKSGHLRSSVEAWEWPSYLLAHELSLVIKGMGMSFYGAKLALFIGAKLVVILRDDKPDIPFPNHWDLPGGGREGDESPKACALRETEEELSIRLDEIDIVWERSYQMDGYLSWFFAAHLPAARLNEVVLGDEGQRWELMSAEDYCNHPMAVPNFKLRLKDYLDARSVELWD